MIDLYWDNAATTAPLPGVGDRLEERVREWFANPSSLHEAGRRSRGGVETARGRLAACFGLEPDQVIFTGCGSEADNLAVRGVLEPRLERDEPVHAITSAVEHKAVLNPLRSLQGRGLELDVVPVDGDGRVDPREVEERLRDHTALVSIMWANNEVGVLQPIEPLGSRLGDHPAVFHSDAIQAAFKTPVDPGQTGVDLISLSGHKFHALKGVGALLRPSEVELAVQLHGGGQEGGIRSGTENIAGIWSMGEAARRLRERGDRYRDRLRRVRDGFEEQFTSAVPGTRILGSGAPRLPNISTILVPGVNASQLVRAADEAGVAVSSGSACASGETEIPSHVYRAMGLSATESLNVFRVSFGAGNRTAELGPGVRRLNEVVQSIRSGSRGGTTTSDRS